MEPKQKVTNINHAKYDIHTLDNLEVTRTFMFNLHIQTILAKIMWDKLAECTASTIDQYFTWKQAFFGPNPTFLPLPPCNVVRKERLADESSSIAPGGKGERANIAAIREKGTLSHTFWPGLYVCHSYHDAHHRSRNFVKAKMFKTNCNIEKFENTVNFIYTVWPMSEMMIWTTFTIGSMVRNTGEEISLKHICATEKKPQFRKVWKHCKSDINCVRNVGNDDLNNVHHS